MPRSSRGVGLFISTASIVLAQEPSPPAVTFSTRTELVQVNVVAKDKHGKLISDLRRDEFQILDNGAPREIRLFVGQQEQSAPEPLAEITGSFGNRLTSPSGSRSGYTVILLDDLYSGSDPTNEEGSTLSRVRALELLKSMPEGERIAIYAPGIKFKVICEFTSDRQLLIRELRKWKPTPSTPVPETRPNLQQYLDPQGSAMQARAAAEMARVSRGASEIDAVEMQIRSQAGDFQFTSLADHLAGIPGRKKLIWLANKFPIGPKAMGSLIRVGISIYPVDIDGVCRLCPPRPTHEMDAIAAVSGGLAYHGRNDLAVAMQEALDDGRFSYTLGFYNTNSNDAPPAPHRVLVTVSRPGVELRYPQTWQPAPPSPSKLEIADLVRAMNRPVDATTIPLQVSATRLGNRLRLECSIGAESLDLKKNENRWMGEIDFAARFTSADAIIASDPITQIVTFNLTQESYGSALAGGVKYRNEFEIPPKAEELKLLFANRATGKLGTLTIPLSKVKISPIARWGP